LPFTLGAAYHTLNLMSVQKRIAIGADHGGYELKQQLIPFLRSQGHLVTDCGTFSTSPVDYPVIAADVAGRIARGEAEFGIIIDGAGIGSAMAANKIPGVRAAAVYNRELAINAREHNDANVLTLGARQTTLEEAKELVDLFLSRRCTADRHLRRVRLIGEIERRGPDRSMMRPADGRPSVDAAMVELDPDDLRRISERVASILSQGAAPASSPGAAVSASQLASMIDHTLLKPEASREDIEKLCREAMQYGFYSVCVNPAYVRQAAALVRGSPVKVCAVVGFPLGAQAPEIKVLEARKAIRDGASEIDMVINVGALKSGDDVLVLRDIRGVVEVCLERQAICKVILETALLSEEEKIRACQLAMKAGAHFVKTSTGFGPGGATEEDVRLMRKTVGNKLGVKASGGIRSYEDALRMIAAGANRIGSSSSVKIIEEARRKAVQ